MSSENIESYHPNNKKGGFSNSSSKPYTLDNIQYNTPPTNINEGSPLVTNRDYPSESSIDIGDGIQSIVDFRIKENINFYSCWGNTLCFAQLVLGTYLYFACGTDDTYFILTTIAIFSHTLSCCLGLYSIAQRHVILLINYTIYAFVILGVNISVFILSALTLKGNYPWWLFISGLIVLNIQFFGIRYLISLILLLRELQNREIHTNIVNTPVLAQPIYVQQPPQPQQYQQVYPGQQSQPQQQYYYYTTPNFSQK